MDFRFDKGYLIIASGALLDPNFHKTVLLICEHQANGSYAIILNRPVTDVDDLEQEMPFIKDRLYQGGPVQPEVMQVIHPYGRQLEGCLDILPGLWLGGDYEALKEGFKIGKYAPAACRFFLGYAGWGMGQLASEFEAGSWLSIPATADYVFHADSEEMWAQSIREYGKDNPLYRFFPDDPTVN